jgi:hypothetical protein
MKYKQNIAILKHTRNVGIEGLRNKTEDVLAYSTKNIMKKIEKEVRQSTPETDELKAGFSKENN